MTTKFFVTVRDSVRAFGVGLMFAAIAAAISTPIAIALRALVL